MARFNKRKAWAKFITVGAVWMPTGSTRSGHGPKEIIEVINEHGVVICRPLGRTSGRTRSMNITSLVGNYEPRDWMPAPTTYVSSDTDFAALVARVTRIEKELGMTEG